MFALSGIFPITLLILGILAAILNRSAHFSRGRFVEWQTFNGVSLATLLKYSFQAIGVPLAIMIVKMPFMSPLDRFPTEDIIGALCYNYGFWHFATGLSIAYAIIMLTTQFIQFIVVLRDSWKRLAIVCLVYFPIMASIFILSMYAVAGIFILFILYFVLSIINDRKQE